jgi:hypothetical protein
MNPSSMTSVQPTKIRRTKAVRHVTEGDDELADGIIVKTTMKNTDNGQVEEMIELPIWINEPAKDLPADPSTTPVPMEMNMNPIEHNFETVDEFYEHDVENTETPGRGQTQSHYIQQVVDRVHPMLKALLFP